MAGETEATKRKDAKMKAAKMEAEKSKTGMKSGTGRVRPEITPGFCLGKLTVREATDLRKNGYTVWNCDCSCGGSIALDTRTLQRGTVRDCGCETKVKPGIKDLTGQRFGRLVCLESTEDRSRNGGSVIWRCRCDCGNECLAASGQLMKGYKKSCGCLGHPPLKEYVGKRFGALTVVEYAGKSGGMHRWKCLCDCGRETIVGQTLLQSGKTKSCGCLRASVTRENLQLCEGTSVTVLESVQEKRRSNNTSGYTGVYQDTKHQLWHARITFKGKLYDLGTYKTRKEAIKARMRGEEMHEDFLEWYYQNYPERKKQN